MITKDGYLNEVISRKNVKIIIFGKYQICISIFDW